MLAFKTLQSPIKNIERTKKSLGGKHKIGQKDERNFDLLSKFELMKNNFSSLAQMTIQFSREEALRLGHDYIGTEHLLLGLIRTGDGKGIEILRNLDADLDQIKQIVESAVEFTGKPLSIVDIPFTKRSEEILNTACTEAERCKSDLIDTEHLLLALVKDKDGVASQVLQNLDITYEVVCEELGNTLHDATSTQKVSLNDNQKESTNESIIANIKKKTHFLRQALRLFFEASRELRELFAENEKTKPILVQFDKVTFDTTHEKFVIILRDTLQSRWLPIVTTEESAQAIQRYVQNELLARPSIYEVTIIMLEVLKTKISKIEITELRELTYYSIITLEQNEKHFEIDARPGDAIALALYVDAPIYVSYAIMENAAVIDQLETQG